MDLLKEPSSTGSSGGVMERARARVKEQLDTQKGKAADGLENVANIVRQSTQPLRDQRHDTTALYVEKAAEHMDRVSTSLRDRDVAELMSPCPHGRCPALNGHYARRGSAARVASVAIQLHSRLHTLASTASVVTNFEQTTDSAISYRCPVRHGRLSQ